jgi:uncharacterized protein (UPF0332 family)
MMAEQKDLLIQARASAEAAGLLLREGYPNFAASRAYYAMFYVAEALLLGRGLAFSKHGAIHAAFGKEFVKTGLVPPEFHRRLIRGLEVRSAADYGSASGVTAEEAREQIAGAEAFLALAERLTGPPA